MKCPECAESLIVLEFEGVEIDHCLSCGGAWLDAGELGLILSGRPDDGLATAWIDAGRNGSRPCPLCRDRMAVAALPGSGVEVDVCRRRHGLWLDRGELQRILVATAGDERTARLCAFCAKIFPPGQTAATEEQVLTGRKK